MKVLLVRNDFLCKRGTVLIHAHGDDFDYLKANFEKVYDVLSEPLVVSPPEGDDGAPKKKKYIDLFGKEVIKQEDCYHDFLPSPFGCDQCTKCGKLK